MTEPDAYMDDMDITTEELDLSFLEEEGQCKK